MLPDSGQHALDQGLRRLLLRFLYLQIIQRNHNLRSGAGYYLHSPVQLSHDADGVQVDGSRQHLSVLVVGVVSADLAAARSAVNLHLSGSIQLFIAGNRVHIALSLIIHQRLVDINVLQQFILCPTCKKLFQFLRRFHSRTLVFFFISAGGQPGSV